MLSLAIENNRNSITTTVIATIARSADFSDRIEQIDGNGQIS